jgi:hypothetical protein
MNKERLMKVLLGPGVSEKSHPRGGSVRSVRVQGATDATKPEIGRPSN